MANFFALESFDILNINLYWYRLYGDYSILNDDYYAEIRGVVYEDFVYTQATDGIESREIQFYGAGVTVNFLGDITGGTVSLVAEFDLLQGGAVLWFAEGFTLSASALYASAQTPSNTDELNLVQQALSGNDEISLSPFDDRMNGYAGDDRIFGAGGNDILDGGPGSDTAVYESFIEDATITFEGSTLVVSSPGGGADRLTNFEFVDFNGEVRSVGSLNDLTQPEIVAASPGDGAVDVAVETDIVLTFSEAIARGTGTIALRAGSPTGTIAEQFDAAASDRISVTGSMLTIDPTDDLEGGTQYFITFERGTVTDMAGNSLAATDSYDITALAPNQPPDFGGIGQLVTTDEDTPVLITSPAFDPDGDPLSFSVTTAPLHGSVSAASGSPNSFNAIYTPDADFNGDDGFVVTVSDGRGGTAVLPIDLTVNPVNDAPSVQPSTQVVAATIGMSADFSVGASDVDGDALSYSASDPAHGTISGGAGGQYTYTPDAGYLGTDSITVTVSPP